MAHPVFRSTPAWLRQYMHGRPWHAFMGKLHLLAIDGYLQKAKLDAISLTFTEYWLAGSYPSLSVLGQTFSV